MFKSNLSSKLAYENNNLSAKNKINSDCSNSLLSKEAKIHFEKPNFKCYLKNGINSKEIPYTEEFEKIDFFTEDVTKSFHNYNSFDLLSKKLDFYCSIERVVSKINMKKKKHDVSSLSNYSTKSDNSFEEFIEYKKDDACSFNESILLGKKRQAAFK